MGNTILVADKSTTIQKIVELTFDDGNFNIHTASDGQAAMEKIPQIRPDLILADISLPVKNGYDLCKAIRTDPQFSEFSNIPVILLAGIYETMDEERARAVEEKVKQVEANDFLSKPFDPQLLISKVKQYLAGEDFQARDASSSSMFAEEPESAINLFDSEPPVMPPDDTEKTMMLPGGPFGSMFASESTPYEEEHPQPPKPPVDIEAIKPANEPVFEEESFSAVELGQEEEEQEGENLFGQSTLKMQMPSEMEDRFGGRNEQEFEYSSGPVLDTHFRPPQEPESIPLILPDAEDPFGDVFQEPQAQWSSAPASEEDSPFGVPEPPPVAEIEADEEEEEAAFAVQEEPVSAIDSPPPLSMAEPEGFDDTWPGVPVKSNMTHPVEELFESDAVPAVLFNEDAEELEPDPSDSTPVHIEAVQEAQMATVEEPVSASATQISEELIERIAERVVNKLSERVVSEIVWQVVPDLAERMIRRELEKLHASEE